MIDRATLGCQLALRFASNTATIELVLRSMYIGDRSLFVKFARFIVSKPRCRDGVLSKARISFNCVLLRSKWRCNAVMVSKSFPSDLVGIFSRLRVLYIQSFVVR